MAVDRRAAERAEVLEALNAFIDGELSVEQRANVAARIAADPDLARAHATLTRLRAGLADYSENVPPPLLGMAPARRGGLWPALALSAASLALAIFVALAFATRPDSPVTMAMKPDIVPAALGGRPMIPDLKEAGLTLIRVDASPQWPLERLSAVYTGPRGCRLELYVRPDNIRPPDVPLATHHRAWQAGPMIYELFAFGMPAKRFGVIADAAERQIRALSPQDGSEQVLREARVNAPPCTG